MVKESTTALNPEFLLQKSSSQIQSPRQRRMIEKSVTVLMRSCARVVAFLPAESDHDTRKSAIFADRSFAGVRRCSAKLEPRKKEVIFAMS
jgi:hypothetical protein